MGFLFSWPVLAGFRFSRPLAHLAYCLAFVSLWRNDLCLVLVAFLVTCLSASFVLGPSPCSRLRCLIWSAGVRSYFLNFISPVIPVSRLDDRVVRFCSDFPHGGCALGPCPPKFEDWCSRMGSNGFKCISRLLTCPQMCFAFVLSFSSTQTWWLFDAWLTVRSS